MAVKVLDVKYLLDNRVPFKVEANIKVLNATSEVQKLNDGDTLAVTNVAEVSCLLEADPSHKDESRHVDKEYPVYMVIGTDGSTASTSSQTLIEDIHAFLSIDEISETIKAGGHIVVALRKFPSKNRPSSSFFRAELINVISSDGEVIG